MPRIKDLKEQQLYRVDKNSNYGELNFLLDKYIDLKIIEEEWDEMIKVAASLNARLVPAHEIVRRPGRNTPSDRLTKAFAQLGVD